MKFCNKVIHIQEFLLSLALTGTKLVADLPIDLVTGITEPVVFLLTHEVSLDATFSLWPGLTSSGFIELYMALNYEYPVYMLRSEKGYTVTELEKRQLFLRSYQFSRKQSLTEKIKKSLFRVKRVIWGRFRSARKLRKILWLKLKNGLFFTSSRRRRRFSLRLHNCNSRAALKDVTCPSYCF
ncbi:unnamed protein product [Fraxinus pennsylvanica]|uniref:Uncharacterized protein n=1 Tax=Fraxinus pennsylvanica TaxID=56036 RepID=A0AAD2DUL3_9LAMI|nr:unnamed protein product [Fraxinus pennsylvanica]